MARGACCLPPRLRVSFPAMASTTTDSSGTDFWVAFPTNYSASVAPIIYITGATNTTGTLTIPGLSYSMTFTVTVPVTRGDA